MAKEGKESERIEGGCINEAARVPTQHHSPSDVCVCVFVQLEPPLSLSSSNILLDVELVLVYLKLYFIDSTYFCQR